MQLSLTRCILPIVCVSVQHCMHLKKKKNADNNGQIYHTCDEFEMGIREIFASFQGDF